MKLPKNNPSLRHVESFMLKMWKNNCENCLCSIKKNYDIVREDRFYE